MDEMKKRKVGRPALPEHLRKKVVNVKLAPQLCERWTELAKQKQVPKVRLLEGWIARAS